MNKNTVWACTINNVVSISCFTILAIVFNKWWIVLITPLMFVFPKSKHRYCRVCDRCGKHSPYADSYNEALDKAKANGWIHHVDGNNDYCPKCRMKF